MFKQRKFIKKIVPIAKKHSINILPSVTIAQAILESGWGESELAAEYNNYFGIKATVDDARIDMYTLEDDGSGNYYQIVDGFKKYDNIEGGFSDHDAFFINSEWRQNNYKTVLEANDAHEQAKMLQKCGYATDTQYANKLIGLIEAYSLQKYDN